MKDDRFTICREANYRSLLSSTSSVLVEQIWSDLCRSSLQSTLQSTTISIRNAISIHAKISKQTVPLRSLSSVNYWAHRFRLREQSDASSHSSDSTLGKLHFEFRDKSHDNLLKIVDGSAKL